MSSLKSELICELRALWDSELSRDNWDGYDAIAVTKATLERAIQFIGCLPDACRVPSLGAEPDGAITFDFSLSAEMILSISVDEVGISYAGFIDGAVIKGSAVFLDEIPQMLNELVLMFKHTERHGFEPSLYQPACRLVEF